MDQDFKKIGNDIIGCAFDIQSKYGRHLLESFYEGVMEIELTERGHSVRRQQPVQAYHKGRKVTDKAYVADMIIDDCVMIENKALSSMSHEEFRQLMTYMQVAGIKLGYLINYGAKDFSIGNFKDTMPWKKGIYRCVNGFDKSFYFQASIP